MNRLIFLTAILLFVNCSTFQRDKSGDVKLQDSTDESLEYFFSKIRPNETMSTNSYEYKQFFNCVVRNEIDDIEILAASYLNGDDSPQITTVLIAPPSDNAARFVISADYDFIADIYNSGFYNNASIDSLVDSIIKIVNISAADRNEVIAQLYLLTTIAANRIYINGCDIAINYHLTLGDIIRIDKNNLNSFKYYLNNYSGPSAILPTFENWKSNYYSQFCFQDSSIENYEAFIFNMHQLWSSSFELINFTNNRNIVKIMDSTMAHIEQNVNSNNKYFYYTIPDLQLYEIEISNDINQKIQTKLYWLNPRTLWRKTYYPFTADDY